MSDQIRSSGGVPIWALAGLLFIAGLPDAMVVPVLRGLTVDRYGMTEGGAHLFISASLVGASIVAGFASRLRRRFGLKRVVCISAAINAMLLILMAFPIGALATMLVRVVEGGADLMVYAVLFDRVASSRNAAKRGAMLGLAATVMMVGIATGMLLGGVIGRTDPAMVLIAGGVACMVLSLLGGLLPLGEPDVIGRIRPAGDKRLMLAPMMQIFADRASAGLLVTTTPIYLASVLGLDSADVGSRVGTIMLVLALGIWPMGKIVDRLGTWRVRWICTGGYAATLVSLPMLMDMGHSSLLACALMGLLAAGLFASAIVLAAEARGGAGGMASFYSAGNAGFFVGPLLAGGLIGAFSGSTLAPYTFVFLVFALLHVGMTLASSRVSAARGTTDLGEDAPEPTRTILRSAA